MGRIEPDPGWDGWVTVRLLRRWAAATEAGDNPLPRLIELAPGLGATATLAVALGSLFQLTEGCLGRRLVPECCCSRRLSADERAVLLLIAAAPRNPLPFAAAPIPHGLPAALGWAAASVRRLQGDLPAPSPPAPGRCPFGEKKPGTAFVPRLAG